MIAKLPARDAPAATGLPVAIQEQQIGALPRSPPEKYFTDRD
jgi:hypothetical protein